MSFISIRISFRKSDKGALVIEAPSPRGVEGYDSIMLVHTIRIIGIPIFSWENVVLSRLTDLGAKL